MRRTLLLAATLALALPIAPGPGARAGDRPAVGTQRLAEPAQAAPEGGTSKRFMKSETGRAPRLSPKPDGVGPILAPLTLKGHRDSPPSTAKPLNPARRIPPPAIP